MSHDRGCHCGKERVEYEDCTDPYCVKRVYKQPHDINKPFNPENLKIGDIFYSVKERNQAFARKKIHKEIDGEDWFKYDKPLRTYEIVHWEVLGILRKQLEGKWKYDPDSIDTLTEYYVRYQDETHMGQTELNFHANVEKYFVDLNEALVYKEQCEQQARFMDIA